LHYLTLESDRQLPNEHRQHTIRTAAAVERKKMRGRAPCAASPQPGIHRWIRAGFDLGLRSTLWRVACADKPEELDFMVTDLGPSSTHWFGTDSLGRDVFSRVVVGSRPIIVMAFCATILGTVVGTTIGLLTGYFKGKFDLIVMRILDAISALPVLILALLALAAVGGSSEVVTILIIGFVFSPIIARTVRATVLGEAELDYVAAAKLRTEKTRHILFVEILPNVLPPIVVEFTIRLGYAVFAIATLSFLGVGVELGSPNWGSQVSENYVGIFSNIWWSTVFPAGAIATLAIGINLLADGIMESFEL
jgi:peptide/nickel transport system permease protein